MSDQKPIDDGGLAFPFDSQGIQPYGGMSLRDWFAGQALGHIPELLKSMCLNPCYEMIAKHSYAIADAMIAARKEGA
jgi:hypothetical protein